METEITIQELKARLAKLKHENNPLSVADAMNLVLHISRNHEKSDQIKAMKLWENPAPYGGNNNTPARWDLYLWFNDGTREHYGNVLKGIDTD